MLAARWLLICIALLRAIADTAFSAS